jgi:DNA-binding CsgD family transcriptional regulator
VSSRRRQPAPGADGKPQPARVPRLRLPPLLKSRGSIQTWRTGGNTEAGEAEGQASAPLDEMASAWMEGEAGGRAATPSHIIKRPRLTKILDESEARIILLCAPAGYGKTTLAREWIATRSEPVYWYAGGPAMADVAALAVDLAELFAGSAFGERVKALAARGEDGRRLAHAIAAHELLPGAVVVLDDCHYASASRASIDLLQELIARCAARFVLCSRERPSWLGARLVIYGEASVMDAPTLALTADEVARVLPTAGDAITQAEGWPALIGLLATHGSPTALVAGDSPAELFEFFATELLDHLDAPTLRTLLVLALGGGVSHPVSRGLLGEHADQMIAAVCDRGLASRGMDGAVAVHPLLRRFLVNLLERTESDRSLVQLTLATLRIHRQWNLCLEIVKRFPDEDGARRVLRDALVPLIDSGRTATVSEWIAVADQHRFRGSIFGLARAEVALRHSELQRAVAVALDAARGLEADLAARAYLTAARALHQLDDRDGTFENALRAESLAASPELRTEALWVAGANAYEREPTRMLEFCERLHAVEDPRPEHSMRVLCTKMFLGLSSETNLREILGVAERAVALTNEVSDPLLQTNAFNMRAHLLRVCGEYGEALAAAEALCDDAARMGLEFVIDHVLITKASALIGLRSLRLATETLREVDGRDASTHTLVNSQMLKAKLKITAGNVEAAALLLRHAPELPTLGIQGEFFALRALAQAALGNLVAAREDIRESAAGHRAPYAEPAALRKLASAVADARDTQDPASAAAAVDEVVGRGAVDALVTACRAFPEFARIAALGGARTALERVFSRSRDTDLGRFAGLEMPREHRATERLSPRETEVLDLIVQGRTNHEIATTLFISDSTAKVHIRHIFEKLGAHTRAEAVAIALGRMQ